MSAAVLLLLLLLVDSSKVCNPPFVRVSKSEYVYASTPSGSAYKTNRTNAPAECRKLHDSADLAIIRDKDVDTWMKGIAQNDSRYIGLDRFNRSNRHIWRNGVFLDHGYNFTGWKSGEGMNLSESCVVVVNQGWYDNPCDGLNLAFCEVACKAIQSTCYFFLNGIVADCENAQGIPCPFGSIPQGTSCIVCEKGKYSDGTSCLNCDPGKFSDFKGAQYSDCESCTAGKYSLGGSSFCSLCEIGTYSDAYNSSSCMKCPLGKRNNALGAISNETCSTCVVGYFRSSENICEACQPGLFSASDNQSQCEICLPGYYASSRASSTCEACQPGSFSELEGSFTCEICDSGSYGSEYGGFNRSICRKCPEGRYSESNARCRNCPEGKYNPYIGANASSYCLDCPNIQNVICRSGISVPEVGPGLFRRIEDPANIIACIPAESCKETGLGTTICSSGYSGEICAECSDNFFRSSGKCLKCISEIARYIILSISAVLIIFAFAKLSQYQQVLPFSLKLALYWFQIFALFPTLSTSWPSNLFSFLDFTRIFNIDIGFIGISCDIQNSPYFPILYAKLLFPLFLFFSLLFHRYFLSKHGKEFSYDSSFSALVFVLNFFSIQLLSSMLEIFNCTKLEDDHYVLTNYPTIQCYAKDWNSGIVVVSVFLFAYLILLPLMILLYYFRTRTAKKEFTLFAPFLQSYREGYSWFEIIKFCSKLVFVITRDILPISSSSKITLLMFMLLLSVSLESLYRPFKSSVLNSISTLWSLSCMMTLFSTLVFTSKLVEQSEKELIGIMVISMICLITSLTVMQAVYLTFRKLKEVVHPIPDFIPMASSSRMSRNTFEVENLHKRETMDPDAIFIKSSSSIQLN